MKLKIDGKVVPNTDFFVRTCECGALPNHTTVFEGKTILQCCRCYVRSGAPPSDWHYGCLDAKKELERERA